MKERERRAANKQIFPHTWTYFHFIHTNEKTIFFYPIDSLCGLVFSSVACSIVAGLDLLLLLKMKHGPKTSRAEWEKNCCRSHHFITHWRLCIMFAPRKITHSTATATNEWAKQWKKERKKAWQKLQCVPAFIYCVRDVCGSTGSNSRVEAARSRSFM